MPRWLAENIAFRMPGEADLELGFALEGTERSALRGPVQTTRHGDGTLSFRGSGIEGCVYPDGTIQTRPETGRDPCCHTADLNACECITAPVDPDVRASVLRQLDL